MKKILITIIILVGAISSFAQTDTVNAMFPNGRFGKKKPVNHLVVKSPLAITTGGGTDTIGCATCGTGSGTVTGTGTATRIAFWRSSTALSSGANINVDSTNLRVGYGTTAPTSTITLDSTRAVGRLIGASGTLVPAGGISLYASTDQVTNYMRMRIYVNQTNGHGYIMANEAGGTGGAFRNLYLNNTNTSVNYQGDFSTATVTATGTITGATIIANTALRWDHSTPAAGGNNPLRLNDNTTYNASSGTGVGVYVGGTILQTGTAAMTAFRIGMLSSTLGSGAYNLIEAGGNSTATGSGTQTNVWTLSNAGKMTLDATNTATGTTGAQTINKPSGKVNFAATATTLVVTNSLVTTSSIVLVTVEGTDATFTSARVTLASGSFTITANAAATAETKVDFLVIN